MMSGEHKGVWIYAEAQQHAYELLGKGRQLADKLGAELSALTNGTEEEAQGYIQRGADKVLLLSDSALKVFQVDTYTDAFSELVAERKPDVLLIGATRNGLDLAP